MAAAEGEHDAQFDHAEALREEGILCGGPEAYRVHVDMVTTVHSYLDRGTNKWHEGVMGDAYVVVDAAELVKYIYDKEQVVI